MSERTLLTGFGPFLEVKENPSAILAEAIERRHRVLPVSYEQVEKFIEEVDPATFDRLLMLGVAPGRSFLSAELFARNSYGFTPDIRGIQRSGAIDASMPLLVGTTLFGEEPLSEVLVHCRHMRLSLDAGSYLCNFTYFSALTAFPGKQVGFLHVPPFEKVPLDEQVQTIRELLLAIESPLSV